jgi:hypothetical protein
MDIAVLAPLSALPRVKKLAQLFRVWGGTPKNHRVRVFTTKSAVAEYSAVWKDLNATIEPVLPGIVRLPPMSENEPFRHVAQSITGTHWFYLPSHTLPVSPDWADRLEKEYLASGKRYLGVAAYIPKRYRDSSGVDRVAPGDPYILEAGIYPANFSTSSQHYLLSRVSHHEISRRSESFPNAALTDSIVSAEWSDAFRLENAPNAAVVTRLVNDAVVDTLLGNFTPPAPAPEPEAETVTLDSAETVSFPVKEPTIKVISRSPTAEEAVTLVAEPVKRPRGRPPKA